MRKLILRKTLKGNRVSGRMRLLLYMSFFSSQAVSYIPPPSLPEWSLEPLVNGSILRRTHTKKNGTFIDKKAHEVYEAYIKKKEAKLAALVNDETADGTSQRSELSQEEDDELFLQSTFTNDRGELFGVGRSLERYTNEKRKYPGSSSSFTSLQERLEEADRKIEQQAALQAEASRVAAEQQAEIKNLNIVKKYLSATDRTSSPSSTLNPMIPQILMLVLQTLRFLSFSELKNLSVWLYF